MQKVPSSNLREWKKKLCVSDHFECKWSRKVLSIILANIDEYYANCSANFIIYRTLGLESNSLIWWLRQLYLIFSWSFSAWVWEFNVAPEKTWGLSSATNALSFPSCFTIADVVLLEASPMQLHERPKSYIFLKFGIF